MKRPNETESAVKYVNTCIVCHVEMEAGTPTYRNRAGNHRHRTCEPKTQRPSTVKDATGTEEEQRRQAREEDVGIRNQSFDRGRVIKKGDGL